MEYINFLTEYYKTNQLSNKEKRILLVFFISFALICLLFFLFISFYHSRYNYLILITATAIFAIFSLTILIKSMVNYYMKIINHEMLLEVREGYEAKKELEELNKNIDKIVSERTMNLENSNINLLQKIEVRNQVERSLIESRKRYYALFNNTPVSIVTVDKNLRVTNCNLAKKTSGERIPEIGDVMYRNYASKHSIDMYLELKECVEKGITKEFPELRYNEKYLNIRISPFFDGAIIASINITDIKNAENTIHVLTRELLRKQELERRNIALNLHDNIAQELASLKISCDSIMNDNFRIPNDTRNKVENFSKILQGSISSVRNIAYELQPPNLQQLGLNTTIFRYCKDFSEQNNLRVDFYSAGIENLDLGFETSINIFRLVQEALSNVKKYAGQTNVCVKLVSAFPNIILRIEDTGCGFDLCDVTKRLVDEKKTGLQNMKERVGMLGGKFDIKSQIDKGTKIYAEIPIYPSHIPQKSEKDSAVRESMLS